MKLYIDMSVRAISRDWRVLTRKGLETGGQDGELGVELCGETGF